MGLIALALFLVETAVVVRPLCRAPVPPALGAAGRGTRYALGVSLVVFVVLSALVETRFGPLMRADTAIETAVHRAVEPSQALRSLAHGLSILGNPVTCPVVAVVVAGLLLYRRQRRAAVSLLVVVLGGMLLHDAVASLVARPRPDLPDPVSTAPGYSFPSGHAMGAATLYGTLLLLVAPLLRPGARRVATAVTVLVIAAVAASRVMLGVHYTTDVVGGVLLGVAWLGAVTLVVHARFPLGARAVAPAGHGERA
ncbi:phosphatase PAP2 family protein [Streptomyces chartreusis]|uniref:phosphatase PAP2 family protein n=1 Tax=Streptomyces chartreusis TaxID=1969 RepID=UPI0033B2C4A8